MKPLRLAGAIPPAIPPALLVAFNGKTASGAYQIGFGAAGDRSNWQTMGLSKIQPGSGWESNDVKDASLVWDGSQYVAFYSGYDGTRFRIGRATASVFNGDWTKYGSNPIVSQGSAGAPDEVGCEFPVVSYHASDSPPWKMWYMGQPAAWTTANPVSTLCFADSTDGIAWTKRGQVIGLGSAGSFNDFATLSGCVYRAASNDWTIFVCGYHDPGTGIVGKSAYCTCTDPAASGTYSALTQLSNYTGNITVGGKTWQSNMPRGITAADSGYLCWVTFWKPTDTSTILEACAQVTSSDLTSWTTPSRLMLPFDAWDSVSAENPSILVAP